MCGGRARTVPRRIANHDHLVSDNHELPDDQACHQEQDEHADPLDDFYAELIGCVTPQDIHTALDPGGPR